MTRVPPSKRDMGMVFQAYSLFPNMTASQNVEYGLKIRGTAKEERATEVAGAARARRASATPATAIPHQLSGGMQQRVALARALAIEPRVAPARRAALGARREGARAAAGGDPADPDSSSGSRRSTSRTTRRRRSRSPTGSRCCRSGRIEQIGAPPRSTARPATPFVAEFIGTMNRLEATVADSQAGEVDYGGVRLAVDARSRSQRRRARARARPARDGRAGAGVERLRRSRAR